ECLLEAAYLFTEYKSGAVDDTLKRSIDFILDAAILRFEVYQRYSDCSGSLSVGTLQIKAVVSDSRGGGSGGSGFEVKRRVLVRRPLALPLCFVASSVLIKNPLILAVVNKFLERSLPKVMHKHIGRAEDAIAALLDSLRVIVIFEHADAELLIERSDF